MIAGPTIRLSETERNNLLTVKRRTGLKHWNVLCRWALTLSLSDPSEPAPCGDEAPSNVELEWSTLGGAYASVYLAILRQRTLEEGLDSQSSSVVADAAQRHLRRGIGALVGRVRSLADLLRLSAEQGVLL